MVAFDTLIGNDTSLSIEDALGSEFREKCVWWWGGGGGGGGGGGAARSETELES